MEDLNENFRAKLGDVLEKIKLKIATCLEEAQQKGEISADLDVTEASDFIFNSFEGAVLKMKVSKTTAPHKVFDRMIFEKVLKG